MKLINTIRKIGLRRTISILYEYKLDRCIQHIICFFTMKIKLRNIIIIESHNDFDCNGGAFYDFLLSHKYNETYIIVWLLKNRYSKELPKNVKKYYLRKPSLKKDYYIARAKYFTSDNIITDKLREDQISIYFDHGPFGLKNCKPFFKLSDSADYYLSSSENYDPIYCNLMSKPYPNPKMIYLGYPMHDIFYKKTGNEVLKITDNTYNKIFLWMPTFRKGGGENRNDSYASYPFGIPLIENINSMKEIQSMLEKNNYLLIIKIHPMQDKATIEKLEKVKCENVIVLTAESVKRYGVDNYRLLKAADALISDYSSVAYSYILLNRPIAFVLTDASELKYGFSVENPEDYIVGDKINSLEDMLRFMDKVGKGVDEFGIQRKELCNWLYKYQDGNSCARIAEFLNL